MFMFENIISVKELNKYIKKDKTIIIDIRNKEKYLKGHVPSSYNYSNDKIQSIINDLKRYDNVIIYCDRGNDSLKIANDLYYKYGLLNVKSVYGGFNMYRGDVEV